MAEVKSMTLEEAKTALLEFKTLSVAESRLRLDELHRAFKVFWDSKPDEDDFEKYLGSVLMTTRIIYYMVKKP